MIIPLYFWVYTADGADSKQLYFSLGPSQIGSYFMHQMSFFNKFYVQGENL